MKKLLLLLLVMNCTLWNGSKQADTIDKIKPRLNGGCYFEVKGTFVEIVAPCDAFNVGDPIIIVKGKK